MAIGVLRPSGEVGISRGVRQHEFVHSLGRLLVLRLAGGGWWLESSSPGRSGACAAVDGLGATRLVRRPVRGGEHSGLRARSWWVHFHVHPVHVLLANVHPFIMHKNNNISVTGAHGAHAIAFLNKEKV
jgi:hypothetical protein